MRILQVSPFLMPSSGLAMVPYHLSKELSRRGHKVTLVTSDYEFDKELANSLEKAGVEVIPFHLDFNFKFYLYTPSMKRWLSKEIKQFDIVHLHDFRTYQNSVTYYYAKKNKIPLVMHVHGNIPRIVRKIFLKTMYDHVYGKKLLQYSTKLIANSKAEVENYQSVGVSKDQIELIYNGFDTKEFSNLDSLESFKERWSISGKYVLFLGRLDVTKGLDFLIKSFSKLLNKVDFDVKLVIVGPIVDLGYKVKLDKLIKLLGLECKIMFIPPLKGKEKLSAYKEADVFVTTANYRSGVLLTPYEALMCGTPVIVSEEVGEILKDENIGLIVKYGDEEGLINHLLYVLENPEKGKEMADRGRKFIMENLTWEKVAAKIEKVYEKCVQSSKNVMKI